MWSGISLRFSFAFKGEDSSICGFGTLCIWRRSCGTGPTLTHKEVSDLAFRRGSQESPTHSESQSLQTPLTLTTTILHSAFSAHALISFHLGFLAFFSRNADLFITRHCQFNQQAPSISGRSDYSQHFWHSSLHRNCQHAQKFFLSWLSKALAFLFLNFGFRTLLDAWKWQQIDLWITKVLSEAFSCLFLPAFKQSLQINKINTLNLSSLIKNTTEMTKFKRLWLVSHNKLLFDCQSCLEPGRH